MRLSELDAGELDAEELEELVEDLAELRHDLGKYICFEVRFAGEDAGVDELRAALRKDLLETSTGRRGTESCWQVWQRTRPEGLEGEPEVEAIAAALDALRGVDLEGDLDELRRGAALSREVSQQTRALHRRVLALAEPD